MTKPSINEIESTTLASNPYGHYQDVIALQGQLCADIRSGKVNNADAREITRAVNAVLKSAIGRLQHIALGSPPVPFFDPPEGQDIEALPNPSTKAMTKGVPARLSA